MYGHGGSETPVRGVTAAPTFPRFVTASSWDTVFGATWQRAVKARGTVAAKRDATPGGPERGSVAPRLSNGEAVALIRGWRDAVGATEFPLWYQYAAVAYGWDPPDADTLDTGAARAARAYPDDIDVALWLELYRIVHAVRDDADAPRLALDGAYDDPVWIGQVRAELLSDGASATFKIPTGFCRDKQTGKRRVSRVPCGKDGKARDPLTGIDVACDKPGDCLPEYVDDPITAIIDAVVKPLVPFLLVWAAWRLLSDNPNKRRRRRSRG